jgi:beta-N-acetylhexosaminidase
MSQTQSLAQLAHRLLIVGFDGHTAPEDTLSLVRKGVGGVILFARNIASPEQVAELNRSIKASAPGLIVSSVDQEGGRVARLRAPWTEWPPLRQLGRSADEALAEEVGRVLGVELRASGFDVDYAPVLDVDSNPANPIIGDRSLGSDPALVGRLGSALIRGLQAVGVAACGKHFPGHGDTSQDSHLTLPRLPHAMDRLQDIELKPFRDAIQAGVASIMTAHVVFEALDPAVPATMSHRVIDGLLRRELGFDGLVISDDLEMKAVHERFPMADVVASALGAGVDAFLACKTLSLQHEVVEHIVYAVESGRVTRHRLEQAAQRMERFVSTWACAASAIDGEAAARLAGSANHRAVAARVQVAGANRPV